MLVVSKKYVVIDKGQFHEFKLRSKTAFPTFDEEQMEAIEAIGDLVSLSIDEELIK